MSSSSEETVSAPPAKKQKISNSHGVTNSSSHGNHSTETVKSIHTHRLIDSLTCYYRFLSFCINFMQTTMAGNGSVENDMQIDEGLYSRQL